MGRFIARTAVVLVTIGAVLSLNAAPASAKGSSAVVSLGKLGRVEATADPANQGVSLGVGPSDPTARKTWLQVTVRAD
jgi:hypothetical protein